MNAANSDRILKAPLLRVEDLAVDFDIGRSTVHAVRGLSFTLRAGEVLAVIGESGSGKSVTIKTVLGTLPSPPARIVSGQIEFEGSDLLTMRSARRRGIQGDRIAMVFQDALAALNPVFTIGWQIAEIFHVHRNMSMAQGKQKAVELLRLVGLPNPEKRVGQYAHQFSGGMRQRVMIAMAIALEPQLLLADEPTTALDVTVQAQIMQLMARLAKESDLAIILVTHNIAIAAEVAERFVVMYAGRIVEIGSAISLMQSPAHPYTRALAQLATSDEIFNAIPGSPPNMQKAIKGCSFAPRCGFATELCHVSDPELRQIGVDQRSACHHAERVLEADQ